MRMDRASLPANLRLAASHVPSVSRLCREIGLNRQQMNKYLAGQNRPSPYNLRRIASYLGLASEDLLLPPDRFAALWRDRAELAPNEGAALRLPDNLRHAFLRPEASIERLLGVYHVYINSGSWPGYVLRYVIMLKREGPWVTTHSLGRYVEPYSNARYIMKCRGIATLQANALSIVESPTIGATGISTSLIEPSYRVDVGLMAGLCIDTPFRVPRRPTAARVVLRFLGRAPDLRAAIAQSAILRPQSGEIDRRIRRLLAEPIDHPVPRPD
jgi:transcriptional regulator with XRE-family HTH domain